MTNNETAAWAEMLDILLTAAQGAFPGPMLEAMIARIEEPVQTEVRP